MSVFHLLINGWCYALYSSRLKRRSLLLLTSLNIFRVYFATSAQHGLPQLPSQRQSKRAQRSHDPKPLRAQAPVEHTGDKNKQRRRCSNADGTVDRLGCPFEAVRNYPCHEAHTREMKQRKGDAVQWLYQRKCHNI